MRFTANIRSAAVRAAFGAALWAFLLDQLDVATGEQVLHLGCGSGYYTAVMAELIGPKGKVIDEFFQVEATSSAGPPANLSVPCSGCVTYAIQLRSDLWDEAGDLDELNSKARREPGAASWRAESIEGS